MRKINWIDFKETLFDKAFPELIQAIDLDREHARMHTVLQRRGSEWTENDCSEEFLMNRTACDRSEIWAEEADADEKQPAPTKLQRDFISESRASIDAAEKTADRRRRIVFASLTAGLIFALILTMVAFFQWHKAEEQTKIAEEKTKEANYNIALAFEEKAGSALEKAVENEDPGKNYFQKAWLYTLAALNQDIPDDRQLPASWGDWEIGNFATAL